MIARDIKRQNDMVSMRNRGLSLQYIGNKYGVSRERVRQIIKGLDTFRESKVVRDKAMALKLRIMFASRPMTINDAASELGVAYYNVWIVCQTHDIIPSNAMYARISSDEMTVIRKLHNDGVYIYEIAKRLGRSRNAVWKKVHQMGLTPRGSGYYGKCLKNKKR